MRVRVKEDCTGFYNGSLRKSGEIFELEAKTHAVLKDATGNPVVISTKEQFSEKWMDRLNKPGPKAKVSAELSSES